MPLFREGISGDSLSLASYHLKMIPNGTEECLATGTGFFYELENTYYLITNGHNVTRINPETNLRTCSSIAFPSKIRLSLRYFIPDSEIKEKGYVGHKSVDIDLYDDEDLIKPTWFVHEKFQYNVDVIAIPFIKKDELPIGYIINPINSFNFQEQFYLEPSDDVFVIGYPFALNGGKQTPIWKRGTIATEPSINLDGFPKFLIDTSTREGMSGSPVILQRVGHHSFGTNGQITNKDIFGRIRAFVGIYSGRIGVNKDDTDNNFKTQLGIVWKKDVIEEILRAKIIGSIEFQNM